MAGGDGQGGGGLLYDSSAAPHRGLFRFDRGLVGSVGERWLWGISKLGQRSADLLGASDPHGPGLGGTPAAGIGGLRGLGPGGVATVVSDDQSASHRG